MRAWLSLHLGSLALELALIRVCVIKLVKISGVGYLAPLTFLTFAPSTTVRELLSVKHINDLLVRSVNAENIFNVFSRIPRATITDLTEFPQGTLSQVDKGFDCPGFQTHGGVRTAQTSISEVPP